MKSFVATINILVSVDSEAAACDALSEALRPLLQEFAEGETALVDWRYDAAHPTPVEVEGEALAAYGFEYEPMTEDDLELKRTERFAYLENDAREAGVAVDPHERTIKPGQVFYLTGMADGRGNPSLCLSSGGPPAPGFYYAFGGDAFGNGEPDEVTDYAGPFGSVAEARGENNKYNVFHGEV